MIALGCRRISLKNMLRGYNLKRIFGEGYFDVEDVLVNSIYIRNLKIMTRLLSEVEDEETARRFNHLYLKLKKVFVEKFYNREDHFFYDVYGKEEKTAKVKTVKGLMPLLLDLPKGIAEELVGKHLYNKEEFQLSYPVPSVAASEPTFEPSAPAFGGKPLLWRGPTWINTNWFIVQGLREHGFKKEAQLLVEKSVGLITKNGFREFFNPITGEGLGAQNFSWSTLVVDMLL
jgi:glycogen debranching enzyme